MEANMNKMEKRNKYSNLMLKLKKATNNEYYYEAIFLEYAILEDRTESLLKHAKIKYRKENEQSFKLIEKLRKIRERLEFQNKYIKKHLPNELIDKIIIWKFLLNIHWNNWKILFKIWMKKNFVQNNFFHGFIQSLF